MGKIIFALVLVAHSAAAAPIRLLGDSGNRGGAASGIAIAAPAPELILTASRTPDLRLEVIRWTLGDGGTVERLGSELGAEQVGIVALASGVANGAPYWAGATTTSTYHRKVIVWQPRGTGVERTGEYEEPDGAFACDVATLAGGRFATLCELDTHRLALDVYGIAPDGAIRHAASLALADGSSPQLAASGRDLVIAYRRSTATGGQLAVGLFALTPADAVVQLDVRIDDAIEEVGLAAGDGTAMTVVRLARDGSVTAIAWTISGSHLVRGPAASNGIGAGIAVRQLARDRWVSADRSAAGTLELDVWSAGRLVPPGLRERHIYEAALAVCERQPIVAVADANGYLAVLAFTVTIASRDERVTTR